MSTGYRGGGVDYGILYNMLVQGVCFAISKLWKAWTWRGGDVIRWKVTEGYGRVRKDTEDDGSVWKVMEGNGRWCTALVS